MIYLILPNALQIVWCLTYCFYKFYIYLSGPGRIMIDNKIRLSSANVQGIRDKKRYDVCNFLSNDRNKITVLCLQDTHLNESDQSEMLTLLPQCNCIIHGSKTNSRGVAIIIKNIFEYSIKNTITDTGGNLLLVDLQMSDFYLRIVNIYTPNNDSPFFFDKVRKYIEDSGKTYTIVCGDFNLVLDPNLDSNNYMSVNNPQSRSKVLQTIENSKLSDVFRLLNPTAKRFTWRRCNPLKQARLDYYFLISQTLADLITNCNIKPEYRSDHSRVDINIMLNTFSQEKGVWKFNCRLLKHPEYLK